MVTFENGTDLQTFTGYRPDLENIGSLLQGGMQRYYEFKDSFKYYEWDPPKELDPRPWFDIHDQGQQGSCQGQSLADAGEFIEIIRVGNEIQLSRSFAYLSSQEFDGLLGRDNGSTLSGGTKAAARGIPLEENFPYTDSYGTAIANYRQKKESILAGKLYKFPNATPLGSAEDCFRWLSSWAGPIQIGIGWSIGNQWEVDSYRSGGGGHAVNLVGYLERQGWEFNIGFLLKNSWGTRWGTDGWCLVRPRAIDQMIASRMNVFVGRSDLVSAYPRRDRVERARDAKFEVRF